MPRRLTGQDVLNFMEVNKKWDLMISVIVPEDKVVYFRSPKFYESIEVPYDSIRNLEVIEVDDDLLC